MVRGFKVCKGFLESDCILPKRSTKFSAGYDIYSMEDVVIPKFVNGVKPVLVKTGIKAYMQDDEVLYLFNRSSNPKKRGLVLANGVGVIDKDYYENPDNDGHIMVSLYNIGETDFLIKKGDAIAQVVFQKILLSDGDNSEGIRKGGFGSTDEN